MVGVSLTQSSAHQLCLNEWLTNRNLDVLVSLNSISLGLSIIFSIYLIIILYVPHSRADLHCPGFKVPCHNPA
ncbi:hypothetical protein BDV37DRAFT_251814 [Aspergillus pseudonomiae]|uniref:Uncharacterized protein n=1 Tax=Aspergillus pseudonomiae TaxID=1506151 RepID=A0A5N7D9Q2_9EURO|nr:uncharacterized protein BDV37DRAFT_251814 [Aspergillus pseudonomiae]KAE8402723.1 hypothetical protein BDV37DRAFT_251814 [Aspergillus pseudonomiae]